MSSPVILRGARVIDPHAAVDAIADIAVAGGCIVAAESVPQARVIDLTGKVICPGFIDLHVHLRTPGQTHKETILSGTRAAAAGGFAAIVAMPNTQPPVDSVGALAELQKQFDESALVRVHQTATLSRGREGKELTDAAALKAGGAVALTDDGGCIQNAQLMLEAMANAKQAGIPVLDHCEDESIAKGGSMHRGACSKQLRVSDQDAIAEELIVARNIILSRATDSPVHIQHISTAGSVAAVRQARKQGLAVTAEAAPHHLILTDDACAAHGTNAKMNPPLRSTADRLAVIEGLRDGTICAIASDHAPHARHEKDADFEAAPFGIVGLEAAVPLCLTELVHKGSLLLPELVALFTAGPRDVLGLATGALHMGAPADITVLDPDLEHCLQVDAFHSLSQNCPYDGWQCRGKAVAVMVNGEWIYSELPHTDARMSA